MIKSQKNGNTENNEIELTILKEYCTPKVLHFREIDLLDNSEYDPIDLEKHIPYNLYLHDIECKMTCYKSDIKTISQFLILIMENMQM